MKELKEDYKFVFGLEHYSNTYPHSIICDNCSHRNRLQVKMGVRVPDSVKCERCGCDTTNPKSIKDIDREGPWVKNYEPKT